MHLGRRPTRLPETLTNLHGIEPKELDPRATWRRVVECAIEHGVAAVLLAGDVVESNNGFMEAYGALQAGVKRLAACGIDVVAVAGNHDVQVLPRLADEIESFRLLGRRGSWESHVIHRDGVPLVRVLGWSFPSTHFASSPLDSMSAEMRAGRFDDDAPDDLRTVGLLHCDLDSSEAKYAPVTRAALAKLDSKLSAWFLGHVHQPSILSGGRPSGYLGSLTSLKPTDLGIRGPWLAKAAPASWELEQLPLSPVRWESPPVSIEGCQCAEDVEAAIVRAIPELHRSLSTGLGEARVVGLRPRLVGGQSIDGDDMRRAMGRARELYSDVDGVLYFVDKVFDETHPRLDLEKLAQGNDPVALFARRLLALQENDGAAQEIIQDARARLNTVSDAPQFHSLDRGLGDEEIRALLMRCASRALIGLLGQDAQEDIAEAKTPEVLA